MRIQKLFSFPGKKELTFETLDATIHALAFRRAGKPLTELNAATSCGPLEELSEPLLARQRHKSRPRLKGQVRMPKSVRPPTEVIESISQKTLIVRQAATQISSRIMQFQKYLAELPGRVEAIAFGIHPDEESGWSEFNGALELALKLHREGKEWIISYGSYNVDVNEDADHPISWSPLNEAPLKIKLAAIQIFPDLLNAIEKSQNKLLADIKAASESYDAFAKSFLPSPTAIQIIAESKSTNSKTEGN